MVLYDFTFMFVFIHHDTQQQNITKADKNTHIAKTLKEK